ncbi:hypothetical protein UZ36_01580 [Candidatus Nitromaritima sp. SCGC AAA799-C22]|nr:hypothetical protein UZ36_01580 [Candidatus Nitromaritima sp. SCGC AAA799-C22]
MRVEFLQSIDFNQMLVFSTFAHLLALTFIMFLPTLKYQEQIVVPTFQFDIIELKPVAKSSGGRSVPAPPVSGRKEPRAKPIAKKPVELRDKPPVSQPAKKPVEMRDKPPVSQPAKKQLPPAKPVINDSETSRKLLADLNALDSASPMESKKSVVEELDQLARLTPEAPSKKARPKSLQEETFKEREWQKTQELLKEPEPTVPPPAEDLLEDFNDIKMKEVAKSKSLATRKKVNSESRQAAERELATLTQQPVELQPKKTTKTASDLFKELEAMEKTSMLPIETPVDSQPSTDSISAPVVPVEKSLQPLKDKLGALQESPVEIEIDLTRDRLSLKDFKSGIRNMKIPVSPPGPDTGKSKTLTFSAHEGSPASTALSLYIGKIYKRVYSKWKTPLGAKAKNVVVAFTIFKKGNIDKPVIRKSAGDETLDSIAVRAIHDSVPFPQLPKELKQPNLRVSIIFKYVPEKN